MKSFCEELQQFEILTLIEAEDFYPTYVINGIINAYLSYTTIMLNSVTIHATWKASSLSKTLKTLLLSLAISDLGIGHVCQPFQATLMVKWLQGNNPGCATYDAFACTSAFFAFASFFSAAMITLDRFLAIHLHLRYRELVTHIRVAAVVIILWVCCAVFSFITLWIPTPIIRFLFAGVETICLVITSVLNIRIYSAVRHHRNQIQSLLQVQRTGEMALAPSVKKSAAGSFYIYIVCLLCFLPQVCVFILVATAGVNDVSKILSVYTFTLMFVNSSLNPVIYCWKMRHIRNAIIATLRNLLRRASNSS